MDAFIPKDKVDDMAYFALSVFFLLWLVSKSIVISLIVTMLFCLGFVAFLNRDKFQKKKEPEPEPELKEDKPKQDRLKEDFSKKIILGKAEDGKNAAVTMDALGHTFIAGMTRYGKTRLLHALVAEFIKFDPEEMQIAFSDAKGVSFNIFSSSRHLFAPIAASKDETDSLIQLALTEMYGRLELFKEYADSDLCTNIDEYMELSGEVLPRIVIIFDELADSVEPDSDAEKNLTTLAKMGLAAGIHLVLSTQRPTKQGISHEVQTQCQTIMSTYMRNKVEYGMISKIPQVIYNNMTPIKGLFMTFSPELAPFFLKQNSGYDGWGFVRSNYYDNAAIKAVAEADRGLTRPLPVFSRVEVEIPKWEGSTEDKFAALKALEDKLQRDIEVADMCKTFGISSRTATQWREKYYG